MGHVPKGTGLLPREKAFIAAYVNQNDPETHLNQTASAAKAYPNNSNNVVAATTGYRLMKRERVKKTIEAILDAQGLTDDVAAQHLATLIKAHDDKGHPDFNAKARGLDMFFRLKGSYAAQKVELGRLDEGEREEKRSKVLELVKKFRSFDDEKDSNGGGE